MIKFRRVWRKVSPYRLALRMIDWLGPRGTLILLCSFIWIQTGIGTLQGYSGVPTDAPHLLVPEIIRGTLWIISAVIALAVCSTRSIHWHRLAITSLSIMPVIRLVSYTLSWLFSWTVFQTVFPHFPLAGAAKAEYSSTFWQAEVLLVIITALAPATWKMVREYLLKEETGVYDRTTPNTSDNQESQGS